MPAAAIPEPASVALLALGAIGAALAREVRLMLVHRELPLEAEIARLGAPPERLVIHVPGEIRGKARAARRILPNGSVRTFVDAKTERAQNWVRTCAVQQVGQIMLEGPLSLSVVIAVAIPPSWSKRKQAEALAGRVRPTGRPDFDNTAKLLCDSLNRIIWHDDSQLVDVRVVKVYGREPGAVIEVGRPA